MVTGYLIVLPGSQDESIAKPFEPYGETHVVTHPTELKKLVDDRGAPDVMIISSTFPDLVNNVRNFRAKLSATKIIVVGTVTPTQLVTLQADDIVSWPLPDDYRLTTGAAQGSTPAHTTTFLPSGPLRDVAKVVRPRGMERVILVCSAEGGDGKTTVTMNLARMLAKWKMTPLVIEADYSGRAFEWLTSQPPVKSIQDFRVEREWDREALEDMLVSAHGIKLLPAALERAPITMQDLDNAIRAFRPYYPLILIDTHQCFLPLLKCATSYASHVILVATQSEKKLPNISYLARQIMEMNVRSKQMHVVVNRATDETALTRVKITLEDYGKLRFYKLPLLQELSEDSEVLYPALGKGEYGQSFRKLCRDLDLAPDRPEPQDKPRKRSSSPSSGTGFLAQLKRKFQSKKKRGRTS